nr:MAG TPA: hypothetical protein [Myoviridae sp. ct3tv2]
MPKSAPDLCGTAIHFPLYSLCLKLEPLWAGRFKSLRTML